MVIYPLKMVTNWYRNISEYWELIFQKIQKELKLQRSEPSWAQGSFRAVSFDHLVKGDSRELQGFKPLEWRNQPPKVRKFCMFRSCLVNLNVPGTNESWSKFKCTRPQIWLRKYSAPGLLPLRAPGSVNSSLLHMVSTDMGWHGMTWDDMGWHGNISTNSH